MADMNEIIRDNDRCRFHGVRGATLWNLIRQAENGQIVLWGRVEDEDGNADYAQGRGELSVVRLRDIDMSINEFFDEDGMIFVLEPVVEEPFEEAHGRRERLVRAEEWRVVGGLRPVVEINDGDEDIADFEAFSLEEILQL